MKTIITLAIAILSLQATADQGQFLVYWPDTNHRFADGSWTLERNSKLQNHTIPEATVSTNGTFSLKGYSNDGGSQALEGMLKAAAEGAAKGAK